MIPVPSVLEAMAERMALSTERSALRKVEVGITSRNRQEQVILCGLDWGCKHTPWCGTACKKKFRKPVCPFDPDLTVTGDRLAPGERTDFHQAGELF